MPTGYTYGVQNGEITTLEDFAKECARGFLWQARESNEKDLIKLVKNTSTGVPYHEERLAKAVTDRVDMDNRNESDWRLSYDAEREDALARHEKRVKEEAEERLRYERMIEKVAGWTPPTEKHVQIKVFMLKQLTESVEFDCGHISAFSFPDFEKWKEDEYRSADNSIQYHQAELKKAKERDGEWLDWVTQLLDSVKGK